MSEISPAIEQSSPIPNEHPGIMSTVIADLIERERMGIKKYGIPLQPFNGKNALVDSYQEAIDLVVYLRQKIEEDRYRRQNLLALADWLLAKNHLTKNGYLIFVKKLETI